MRPSEIMKDCQLLTGPEKQQLCSLPILKYLYRTNPFLPDMTNIGYKNRLASFALAEPFESTSLLETKP